MLCDSTPDVLVKNRCIDRHRHNIKHRKTSKNHRCSMHRCFFTSLTQTSSPNRQDLRRLTQTSEIRVPYDEGPMSPRRDVEVSTPIVPCSEYLAGFELVTDTEDDEEERPLFRRSFVASPQQDQTAETIPSRVYVERSRPESARILWSTTREDGNPQRAPSCAHPGEPLTEWENQVLEQVLTDLSGVRFPEPTVDTNHTNR